MSRRNQSSPPAAGRDAGAASAGTPPAPGAAGAGGTGPVEPSPAGATGQAGEGAAGPVGGGPGPAFDPDPGSGPVGGAGPAAGGQGFGEGRPAGDLGADDRTEAQLRDYAARTTEGVNVSAKVAGMDAIEAGLRFSAASVGVGAAATLAAARPQDAARVLDAAAGSASEAPSIGPGGLVDLAAREIPGAVAVGVPVGARIGTAAGVAPGLLDAGGSHGAVPEPIRDLVAEHEARRAVMEAKAGFQRMASEKLAAAQPESPEALADLREAGFDFVVTSRQLNFRRAGVIHPTSPTLRRTKDFALSEFEALIAEPMLVVTLL